LTDVESFVKCPCWPKTTGKGIDMADIVAYFRVSTKQQGDSGLGLEAQKAAVEAYAKQSGARILASYREVESGKLAERPELTRALAHAKRSKATLCVAKLDRLARNVAFLSALMRSGVDFVCCDNPHANKLTIHILAAVAEDEAERISARTKAALAAAKARGVKLGSAKPGHWNGREEARLAGLARGRAVAAKVVSQAARDAYADLLPTMQTHKAAGLTLQAIADKLNAEGHTTRRGKPWNVVQVMRVLQRA
jgi:DNA invertase Pin-like site-specific DNA recombinase